MTGHVLNLGIAVLIDLTLEDRFSAVSQNVLQGGAKEVRTAPPGRTASKLASLVAGVSLRTVSTRAKTKAACFDSGK